MRISKGWLTDPEVLAARLRAEEAGFKPRRRGWAAVSLIVIIGPLIVSVIAPWAHNMVGIQGFLLGLLVAWGIWRLVEHEYMEQRFRATHGRPPPFGSSDE